MFVCGRGILGLGVIFQLSKIDRLGLMIFRAFKQNISPVDNQYNCLIELLMTNNSSCCITLDPLSVI